jgi:hypothetical protein
MFGLGEKGSTPPIIPPAPANVVQPKPPSGTSQAAGENATQNQNQVQPKKKKKGFFGKIFGVFKDDDKKQNQQPQ